MYESETDVEHSGPVQQRHLGFTELPGRVAAWGRHRCTERVRGEAVAIPRPVGARVDMQWNLEENFT